MLSRILIAATGASPFVPKTTISAGVPGNVSNQQFGCSLSVSADGNFCTAGLFAYNLGAGGFAVYKRIASTWQQVYQQYMAAPTSTSFGYSVNIAKNGSVIAVGAPNTSSASGEVKIYVPVGVSWTQQSSLTGSGLAEFYGASAVFSRNGSTLAVSAPYYPYTVGPSTYKVGRIEVYSRDISTGALTLQGQFYPSFTSITPIEFNNYGWGGEGNKRLAISGDGNTLAISAPGIAAPSGGSVGIVQIFTRSGGVWSFQQQINSAVAGNSQFGTSISLTEDGNGLLVGAPSENTATGRVYWYTRSGGFWTQVSSFTGLDSINNDIFGTSVAISSNGLTCAVGAANAIISGFRRGASYVFRRASSSGVWTQSQKVVPFSLPRLYDTVYTGTPLDINQDMYSGVTLGLASDSINTLVSGAPSQSQSPSTLTGALFVYS